MDKKEAHLRKLIFRKTGGLPGTHPRIMEDQNYQIELVDNGNRTYTARITDSTDDSVREVYFNKRELRKRANRSVLELVAQPELAAHHGYEPTAQPDPTTFDDKVNDLIQSHDSSLNKGSRQDEYEGRKEKIERAYQKSLSRSTSIAMLSIPLALGAFLTRAFQSKEEVEKPAIVQTYEDADRTLSILAAEKTRNIELPFEPKGFEGDFKRVVEKDKKALDELIAATKKELADIEVRGEVEIEKNKLDNMEREKLFGRGLLEYFAIGFGGVGISAACTFTAQGRRNRKLKKLDRKFGKSDVV